MLDDLDDLDDLENRESLLEGSISAQDWNHSTIENWWSGKWLSRNEVKVQMELEKYPNTFAKIGWYGMCVDDYRTFRIPLRPVHTSKTIEKEKESNNDFPLYTKTRGKRALLSADTGQRKRKKPKKKEKSADSSSDTETRQLSWKENLPKSSRPSVSFSPEDIILSSGKDPSTFASLLQANALKTYNSIFDAAEFTEHASFSDVAFVRHYGESEDIAYRKAFEFCEFLAKSTLDSNVHPVPADSFAFAKSWDSSYRESRRRYFIAAQEFVKHYEGQWWGSDAISVLPLLLISRDIKCPLLSDWFDNFGVKGLKTLPGLFRKRPYFKDAESDPLFGDSIEICH
eukprot:GHVP01058015.1.p1 GENE.GHVP01058015.1~~GHVP01058015.1.p1  ORF type:complete len:342 (-),score=67.97 GHVP01058015.1:452-1477(-)